MEITDVMPNPYGAFNGRYILDEGGNPVPEPDLFKWGKWLERRERILVQTPIAEGIRVSTVFLGLDHDFTMKGPPVLWETMIFGGAHDQSMWRYTSRAEALVGHVKAVDMARAALGK